MGFLKHIHRLLRFSVFVLISLLVVTVVVGVFFRYVLHSTLHWAVELPNFLFMWIIFLGAAVAYREKRHIGFTMFLEKLPLRMRGITETVSLLILAAFFVFLLITGTKVVLINMQSETEALKIPYGIVYAGVPISSLLMLLESIAELWRKARGKK